MAGEMPCLKMARKIVLKSGGLRIGGNRKRTENQIGKTEGRNEQRKKTRWRRITLQNALCRRDCLVPIERIVYNKAGRLETGPS
jgi:hypothetical protein